MMIRQQVSCDVCKVDKKGVNHWFAVWVVDGIFRCGEITPERVAVSHVCGIEHATILFHRFLSTGVLDMEKHPDTASRPVGLTEEVLLGSNDGN